MSARMMWFIKLDAEYEKCTVLISDGILIGKEDSTQKLIRFIMLADKYGVLDHSVLEKWYRDFKDLSKDKSQKEDKSNNKRNRRSSSEDDFAVTDYEHKGGSPKRRNKNDSGDNGTVHNSLTTLDRRPSNIARAVRTDTSYSSSFSSPIKTAECSAGDHCFTNKIISPDPEAPDMGNTSGNIKSIDQKSSNKRMTDEEQMMLRHR